MFEMWDIETLILNGELIVSGRQNGDGYLLLKKGTLLTDGTDTYKITGIPFMHYNNVENLSANITLQIENKGYSSKHFDNKTLKIA